MLTQLICGSICSHAPVFPHLCDFACDRAFSRCCFPTSFCSGETHLNRSSSVNLLLRARLSEHRNSREMLSGRDVERRTSRAAPKLAGYALEDLSDPKKLPFNGYLQRVRTASNRVPRYPLCPAVAHSFTTACRRVIVAVLRFATELVRLAGSRVSRNGCRRRCRCALEFYAIRRCAWSKFSVTDSKISADQSSIYCMPAPFGFPRASPNVPLLESL